MPPLLRPVSNLLELDHWWNGVFRECDLLKFLKISSVCPVIRLGHILVHGFRPWFFYVLCLLEGVCNFKELPEDYC